MTDTTPANPNVDTGSAPSVPSASATTSAPTDRPRWAGFEPLENPRLRIKIKSPRTNPLPPGHWAIATVFAIVAAAYSVACVYFAYIEHQGVELIQRARSGGDVTLAEAMAWHDRSAIAYTASLLCLLVIFFGCLIWMAFLGRRVGRRDFMAGHPARIAWLAGVVVSFVMNIAGRASQNSADPISATHWSIVFYLVRAVVGLLYLWMFVALASRSATLLRGQAVAQPPASQAGVTYGA